MHDHTLQHFYFLHQAHLHSLLNHHACHRFLKKAPKPAICVCPPLDKGLFTTTSFPPNLSRGVWHSRPTTRNEAVGESGKQGLISPAYLLVSPQAVTPIFHFLIHGRLHDTSHKPTRPQQLRRRLSADVQRCSAERGKLC